jgi:hypothetical protein
MPPIITTIIAIMATVKMVDPPIIGPAKSLDVGA